jgi:tRNA threonylcarbamoyladenosine biosynthesis protein TsaB
MDARMDEIYAGAYRWETDRWQGVQPPALWTLPALCEHWRNEPALRVAGSALSAFAGRLPTGGAQCVAAATDRAGALLRIARHSWAAGEAVDPGLALPLYLRDKVALTTAEREGAR